MNELSAPEVIVAGIIQGVGELGMKGAAAAGDRLAAGLITATPGTMVALSEPARAARLSTKMPQSTGFFQ